jgi:DNA-binding winged helix-turn-helix (wHTH) protein
MSSGVNPISAAAAPSVPRKGAVPFAVAIAVVHSRLSAYQFKDFVLVPGERLLLRGGAQVRIAPKMFDLLAYFVRNPTRVITKEELVDQVWGGQPVTDNNIAQHVYALRRVIAEDAAELGAIKTVYGEGFSFVERVRPYAADGTAAGTNSRVLTAIELLQNARYFYASCTDPGLRSAIELCRRALELHPHLAPAHALTALAYVRLADWFFEEPAGAMRHAREAAQRALLEDEDCAEGLAALAGVQLYFDYDPRAALASCKRALEIQPALPYAHVTRTWSASLLRDTQEVADALGSVHFALSSPMGDSIAGAAAYFRGEYDAAVALVSPQVERDANQHFPRYIRGASALGAGRLDAAIADLDRIRRHETTALSSGYSEMHQRAAAALTIAYARAGDRRKVHDLLRELQAGTAQRRISPLALAIAHAAAADREGMYAELDRALRERDPWLIFIRVERYLQAYEDEPRFTALSERIFEKFA